MRAFFIVSILFLFSQAQANPVAYGIDDSGYYVGQVKRQESPLESGKYLIPANAILNPPPEKQPGKLRRFIDGSWHYVTSKKRCYMAKNNKGCSVKLPPKTELICELPKHDGNYIFKDSLITVIDGSSLEFPKACSLNQSKILEVEARKNKREKIKKLHSDFREYCSDNYGHYWNNDRQKWHKCMAFLLKYVAGDVDKLPSNEFEQ